MAIQESHINRFNGGIEEDKRALPLYRGNQIQNTDKFSITKSFDTYNYQHKLVPYPKTIEDVGFYAKNYDIVQFLYAPNVTATPYVLYGLGVVPGTTKPKVYSLDVDAQGIGGTTWNQQSNGASSVTNRNTEVFFYYKGFIYMYTGIDGSGNITYLVRFDTSTIAAFNDSYQTVTCKTVAHPVHHPSDDIAYFFHDNKVSKLDNTSYTANVLTLPSNMRITSACAHGNYLAIACVTLGNSDVNSTVFLWDRDSSLTTLTTRANFGSGTILHLAELDNKLIAVMNYYVGNYYGLQTGRCLIKTISGNSSVVLNQITTDTNTSATMPLVRTVKDNKLYFAMAAPLNGDIRLGVWVVDSSGRLTLDIAQEGATSYEGIYKLGNIWFFAHSNDGTVTHTSAPSLAYSTTNAAIYESLIFNGGELRAKKKLIGVTVTTEPLSASGQVVFKYRKDNETAWTTIFTFTGINQLSHSAINIESTGDNLPEFKEIQWRIESTGGAVITGYKWHFEMEDKDLY